MIKGNRELKHCFVETLYRLQYLHSIFNRGVMDKQEITIVISKTDVSALEFAISVLEEIAKAQKFIN